MRLGFVGMGRWARKLKASFDAEGAIVVASWRAKMGHGQFDCWGDMFRSPEVMIDSEDIDALVLCAPPDVTTEVALACAAAGKPVMATKPLMLTEAVPIRAPFYVDFWRLWSEAFERYAKARTTVVNVLMTGSGPIRGFPGLLDYGPHAMAYLHRLLADVKIERAAYDKRAQQGELLVADGPGFTFQAGNGDTEGYRSIQSPAPIAGWNIILDETPEHMVFGEFKEPKELVIRRMCRSFMNDIAEGFVTTEHLDLSCAVMRDLAEVRRLAEAAR